MKNENITEGVRQLREGIKEVTNSALTGIKDKITRKLDYIGEPVGSFFKSNKNNIIFGLPFILYGLSSITSYGALKSHYGGLEALREFSPSKGIELKLEWVDEDWKKEGVIVGSNGEKYILSEKEGIPTLVPYEDYLQCRYRND